MKTSAGKKSIPRGKIATRLGFLYHAFLENKVPPFYSGHLVNHLENDGILKLPLSHKPKLNGNSVHLLTNVPDYISLKLNLDERRLKCKKISQYPGYLVNLNGVNDGSTYLEEQLSKRNRKNLFAKKRKLETNHPIRYIFYYGDISKNQYDFLFSEFYTMLKKRFIEKKMYNNNLLNWKFYHELVYPLILKKKASLFVIYDGEKPITITLNFHLKNLVSSAIQTYDINYSKYNMGDISMLKHIEWCIANNIIIFDLGMGYTAYKVKWCNHIYRFNHHLFYHPANIISMSTAALIITKCRLRQFLRDKNVIGKRLQLSKLLYRTRVKQLANFNWKES